MSDRSIAGNLSVLVVDDHRISREYTAASLRAMGASVRQAGSAAAALRSALREPPQLMFVDLQLAGESGLDLIDRLRRSWPAGRPLPRVWVLSAEHPPPDRLRPLADVIEGFLAKPVEPDRLRALLTPPSGRSIAAALPPVPDAGFNRLYREELRIRLTEIDECISSGNRGGAEAILHQLIASSRLCGERGLESALRAMLAACREGPADGLARSYYAVWTSVDCYLASGGRVRTG